MQYLMRQMCFKDESAKAEYGTLQQASEQLMI